MDEQTYNDIVAVAIWDGGVAGGHHLDKTGKADTPLGQLNADEYFAFLEVVHNASEAALKERIAGWTDSTGEARGG